MTPTAAAAILRAIPHLTISGDSLQGINPYISCVRDDDGTMVEVVLDSEFTADQLEAIATWMREPWAVTLASQALGW